MGSALLPLMWGWAVAAQSAVTGDVNRADASAVVGNRRAAGV